MKDDMALERHDIAIDREMEVDCDIGHEITAYIETWFDVEKKFGITLPDDSTWLNMYAKYNPYEDTLRIECEIDKENGDNEYFDYKPNADESDLIKTMIAECIMKETNKTPQEYCEEFYGTDDLFCEHNNNGMTIGGI